MTGPRPGDAAYTGWTRDDWVNLLGRLTDGFVRAIPRGGSPAAARLPGAVEPGRVPWIEGFARLAVGWAAWLHEPTNPRMVGHAGRRHDIGELLARGLVDATDPAGRAWWGPIGDRDQRIVEAAEVATALWLGGGRLRAAIDAVDPAGFERILDWLALVDGRDVWPDNWVLFPMMSRLARRVGGRHVHDETIDDAVDWMAAHHAGDGWYSDGSGHALDLYTGWAIHWHLLWWASIDGGRRPRRRAQLIGRARTWIAGTAPMFAADGSFPRFGRSLGYRFAIAAPFVQAAFLGIDPLPPGAARRLASGVTARALELGAIDPATDWLRVGVGAEKPAVVEGYVTPGAVAWAAHAFLALAMPPSHPFWAAPEAPLPADRGPSGQLAAARAGWLVSWTPATGETRIHNARTGHPADIADHDYAATYGKLVYRSAFPADVPIGTTASPGADDAVTAIAGGGGPQPVATSAGQPGRAHRNESLAGSAGPGWILSRYRLPTRPAAAHVTTVVLVLDGAEVRVSLVRPGPGTSIAVREGAASLGGEPGDRIEVIGAAELGLGPAAAIRGERGTVAIKALAGYDRAGCEGTSASLVNLVHARAAHPFVEESAASTRPRLLASVALATLDPSPDLALLAAVDVRLTARDVAEIRMPGAVAVVAVGTRAPACVDVGSWIVRGPGIRVVQAAIDGTSLRGERIASIDGVLALSRPGIVAVERVATGVDVSVGSGVRLDAGWAGSGLVDVAVRRGAGPFESVGRLDEPGVVPDRLVRRLARRAGTGLVTLRLERAGA